MLTTLFFSKRPRSGTFLRVQILQIPQILIWSPATACWHKAHTALPQGAGKERCSQAIGRPAFGPCVVPLPHAASRRAAPMVTLAPASHIPVHSAFLQIVYHQPKLQLGHWHEQTGSTNKATSISHSTRQARIKFVIPQMMYGSESHLPITLRQGIKPSTSCKNCTFPWRPINTSPLKSFWLICYWIAARL